MTPKHSKRHLGTKWLRVALLLDTSIVVHSFSQPLQAENGARWLVHEAISAKERAIDSRSDEDWLRALELFRRAHAVSPTGATAYEIGIAAAELERTDEAFEAFDLAISLGLQRPALLKAVRFQVAHEQGLSRLLPQCADGSRVYVRGIERGMSPLKRSLFVLPGIADVECLTPNEMRLRRKVTLVAGQEHVLALAADSLLLDVAPAKVEAANRTNAPRGNRMAANESSNQAARRGASPTSIERAGSATRGEWILVGAGASLALWGSYLALLAGSQIGEGRQALAGACQIQVDGRDSCRNSKWNLQAVAQSHSDSIATWKATRNLSWVFVGVGSAAAALGAVSLVFRRGTNEPSVALHIGMVTTGIGIHYHHAFR